jgi:gas vesicle protein
MNARAQGLRDHSFVMGLLTGAFAGASLTILLAPRISERRHRVTGSAKNLGERASERYQQATSRVVEAVDELMRRGQDLRNDAAETVARGAHKVERYATAAKGDRAITGS